MDTGNEQCFLDQSVSHLKSLPPLAICAPPPPLLQPQFPGLWFLVWVLLFVPAGAAPGGFHKHPSLE